MDQHKADRQNLLAVLNRQGIRDPNVLQAIGNTPREHFVNPGCHHLAYDNVALPLAFGQTISQPYVVAAMTQLLIANGRAERVLEVGTGSGYQAAILSHLADAVYTIERVQALYERANRCIQALGYGNVYLRHGDGHQGWPEHAPYGAILVTAAVASLPKRLLGQLATPGRIVVPLGASDENQWISVIDQTEKGLETQTYDPVRFVPLRHGLM